MNRDKSPLIACALIVAVFAIHSVSLGHCQESAGPTLPGNETSLEKHGQASDHQAAVPVRVVRVAISRGRRIDTTVDATSARKRSDDR